MIRNLKVQDAQELYIINKEQLGYNFPLDLTEKKLAKLLNDTAHHFFLGFEEENTKKILGYVHAEVYDLIYSNTVFNVLSLAVSKESENQAIGKALMQALEQEATNRNYEAIRLNSGMDREDAHKFYGSIGYDNDRNHKRFTKFIN